MFLVFGLIIVLIFGIASLRTQLLRKNKALFYNIHFVFYA